MKIQPSETRRAILEWAKILAVSAAIIGYITFLAYQSEAQSPNTAEQRQTRALEKIASELEQLRRCECQRK